MTSAAPRRYVVVIQPAEGLPADGPYEHGQEPRVHTAVLAVEHDAVVAERDRLRAANVVLANNLRVAEFDRSTARSEKDAAVAAATLTLAQALRSIRDSTGAVAASIAERALRDARIADPVEDLEF